MYNTVTCAHIHRIIRLLSYFLSLSIVFPDKEDYTNLPLHLHESIGPDIIVKTPPFTS